MRQLALGAMVFALACGGGEAGGGAAAGGGGGDEGGAAQAAGPMGQASVVGSISFDGAVPPNPTIDMAEEPDCVAKHDGAPIDPQVVVQDGKLANVFVYVKSGLPDGATYTAASTPATAEP